MNNLKIRQLEDNIVELLNLSDVEIEVKRLIIVNVLSLIEEEADKTIRLELSQPITEYGEMKDAEGTRREQE